MRSRQWIDLLGQAHRADRQHPARRLRMVVQHSVLDPGQLHCRARTFDLVSWRSVGIHSQWIPDRQTVPLGGLFQGQRLGLP